MMPLKFKILVQCIKGGERYKKKLLELKGTARGEDRVGVYGCHFAWFYWDKMDGS